MTKFREIIPADVLQLYEVHDFKHAAAILSTDFPEEFSELLWALRQFRFTDEMVRKAGGNESEFPKAFSAILRPKSWEEKKLTAKLVVSEETAKSKKKTVEEIPASLVETVEDGNEVSYGTHKIDYVKGKIALDLEWNSKDQTFDRDLYAFRAFFEYGKIDVAVLVTRSNELDSYFKGLGTYTDQNGKQRHYKDKYGASTTHMGKLLPRVQAGRQGGCPLLVFGITTSLRKIED